MHRYFITHILFGTKFFFHTTRLVGILDPVKCSILDYIILISITNNMDDAESFLSVKRTSLELKVLALFAWVSWTLVALFAQLYVHQKQS